MFLNSQQFLFLHYACVANTRAPWKVQTSRVQPNWEKTNSCPSLLGFDRCYYPVLPARASQNLNFFLYSAYFIRLLILHLWMWKWFSVAVTTAHPSLLPRLMSSSSKCLFWPHKVITLLKFTALKSQFFSCWPQWSLSLYSSFNPVAKS